jgi:hypothetical protein
MRPLFIFDLDGTLALIDHRRHLVDKHSCLACYGTGHKRREPPEVAKMVLDSRGRPTALPATDPCTECGGTGHAKQDWRAFFAACVDDEPNLPVIQTLQALRRGGAECWIWSGRSDEVYAETVKWLCKHGIFGWPGGTLIAWPFNAPERFRMRKAGDFTPDEQLKFGWLADMEPPERKRLTGVFDDRERVVQMWRRHGVPCFQVAPGEF